MEKKIDESLYSRQLYVMGKEAMQTLSTKKVLISGMNGLGLEVAKNVVLSGVSELVVHDTDQLQLTDLSSFFYASRKDIGRNRAEVCLAQLCELNEYVSVSLLTKALTEQIVASYDVVVLCDAKSSKYICEVNSWVRNNRAKFILPCVRGLFTSLFCDFGDEFIVKDVSGSEPEINEISTIEKGKDGLVYVVGDKGHGLCDESYVTFTNVGGMTELNDLEPMLISVNDYRSFFIGNNEDFGDYIQGTGLVKEVFLPKKMHFKPFSDFLETAPSFDEIVISDYGKLKYPSLIHTCFLSLNEYFDKYGHFPQSWNSSDADNFQQIVKEMISKFPKVTYVEEIVRQFSYCCRGNLNPLHASIGGIAAQEVLKAATQQFTPIHQWYFSDFLECLPEDYEQRVDSKVYGSSDSRYDGQEAVFGTDFQEKIEQSKFFVVGAGAIGCEMLKNFAMMGLGCGDHGKVFVTDMDYIERSNLNRQFLFRNWNIGQPKSVTAAKAVTNMNPLMKIEAHENRLDVESENFYNNTFFQNLTCVVNALDNIEARAYAASRIEFNGRPMIDSGTMGPQASQQVIIPGLSKSYKLQRAENTAIPICTLKNFPYQIEHTIQWAKDMFVSHFTSTPKLIKIFLQDKAQFFENINKLSNYQKFDSVNQVLSFFKTCSVSFDKCTEWALNEWFLHFSKNIQQMLFSFPPDFKTAEGLPFWSGTKRVPQFEVFNPDKPSHLSFVVAAAKLRSRLLGIELGSDKYIRQFSEKYEFEKFVPNSETKIATQESEIETVLDLCLLERRINELKTLEVKVKLNIQPQEFEKDDDSNFHIDFIVAASNMRAFNYSIEQADRMKTKKIAGRIIPAIATTTSVITGQVCMEIYKLLQGHTNIRKYRDSFLNLASPVFTMTIPERPPQLEVLGKKYSIWDYFDVEGDITLREFFKVMKVTNGSLDDVFDKTIRPYIDIIDAMRKYGLEEDLDLPTVVVVGDQSSGKSSIIEIISGIQLPRGTGIFTRCPLELQLKKVPNQPWKSTITYKDCNKKEVKVQISDPEQVESCISKAQDDLCKSKKGVSKELITLKVESPEVNAPDLTMIDLPGISRTAVEDQPSDIYKQIKKIIMDHVKNKNTVILCVISGDLDVAVNESVNIARLVDPEGLRTIGVITKPDIADVDHKQEVLEMMDNKKIKLTKGFNLVKCRSSAQLKDKIPLSEFLKNEMEFYENDEVFKHAKRSQVGALNLARKITVELVNVIKLTLPNLKLEIDKLMNIANNQLDKLPQSVPMEDKDKRSFMMNIGNDLNLKICDFLLRGKLHGGVNYHNKWREQFTTFQQLLKSILAASFLKEFSIKKLQKAIDNDRGKEISGFLSYNLFEKLIKSHVKKYKVYACNVQIEIGKIIKEELDKLFAETFNYLPMVEKEMKKLLNLEYEESMTKTEERIDFIFKQEEVVFTMDDEFERMWKNYEHEPCASPTYKFGNDVKSSSSTQQTTDNAQRMFKHLKSYLEIVHIRLCDNVPNVVMQCLMFELFNNLKSQILKYIASDEINQIEECLTQREERLKIMNQIESLKKGKKELTYL